jgi:hypothetical protein
VNAQDERWQMMAAVARRSFEPNEPIEVSIEDREAVGSRVVSRAQRVAVYPNTPRYILAAHMVYHDLMPSEVARALSISMAQVLDLLRGVYQFDHELVEAAIREYRLKNRDREGT